MNLQQRLAKIEELQAVETPWAVKRVFGEVQLFGAQFSIYGSSNNDFVSIDEAQQAIQWLVEQLGGAVKWAPKASKKKEKGEKNA